MKLTRPEGLIVILVGIGLIAGVCNLSRPTQAPQLAVSGIDALMDAIEWKESKCDSQAVGDSGNAVGSFQIWMIMVDDVNRILRVNRYSHLDRTDRVKSREMCRIFLEHYCEGMSNMNKARCWNGGPRGYTKIATIDYGIDVVAIMEDRAK